MAKVKNNNISSYITTPFLTDNENATKLVKDLVKTNNDYPILSKKKERELIEQYKDDRSELNRKLILHNTRLVYKLSSKYSKRCTSFDDLIFDGLIGLAIAASRFDITKNIKFSTYATPWIVKYLLMNVKYNKNYNIDVNSTSLQSQFFQSDSIKHSNEKMDAYLYNEIEPSMEYVKSDICSDIDQSNIVSELFNKINQDSKISATDKLVADELFNKQLKVRDIIEKYEDLNLDTIKVNRIKYKILNKFKKILKDDYQIESYSDFQFS